MAKATSGTATNASKKSAASSKSAATKKKTDTRTDSPMMNTNGSAASSSPREINGEDRNRMIQYAAYHIAEKDGFQQGREQDYWFQAEKQINDLFTTSKSSSPQASH